MSDDLEKQYKSFYHHIKAQEAFITRFRDRISELEAENAGLSANQCLHDIHGDESGNLYCPRIAELEAALLNLIEHTLDCELELDKFHGLGNDAGAGMSSVLCEARAALGGGKKDE